MKFLSKNKVLWILASLALFVFVAGAYAGHGYGPGYGRHGGQHGYMNRGYMNGYGSGWANLSGEQLEQAAAERESFHQATSDLRNKLQEKKLAMRAELAANDPDVEKVKKIRKELSQLEAQFDDKWVDHVVKMKKINPGAGKNYYNRPRGENHRSVRGYHHGPRNGGYGGGYGPGPRGNCWR